LSLLETRENTGPAFASWVPVPRLPRSALVHKGSLNHCTWRSHDHSMVLESPDEKRKFLSLIREYKARFGIRVVSYCIMGTHPHLVVRCAQGQKAFSSFWKVVNQRFARWYNRKERRRGQVVMERLTSSLIQSGIHLLNCMRYGDLNPVRAGLVRSPKDFAWSSYRHYAFSEPDDLVDEESPEYLALARTAPQRRKAYVQLFSLRQSTQFRVWRPDLVKAPFIGERHWIAARFLLAERSPPS
jgi:putative transposase